MLQLDEPVNLSGWRLVGPGQIENRLPGFTGWLMRDGWHACRHLPNRLRCWAHLTRKAQGLIDRFDREAKAFGYLVQGVFDTLIGAIAEARAGPPGASDLPTDHAERLVALRRACERHVGHRHARTHALALYGGRHLRSPGRTRPSAIPTAGEGLNTNIMSKLDK